MYDFHKDKPRYFDMQYRVTKEFIIPFIKNAVPDITFKRVLEIGCAEAGVLKAFLEQGAFCTGIELSQSRIDTAATFHEKALQEGRIEFINRNIFDIDPQHDLGGPYDLVVLKDVIEHIPGQLEFINQLRSFVKSDGYIFFAFPPWAMPYGGHQQLARHSILARMPYYHLLPAPVYKFFLQLGGESKDTVRDLMEIKETGLSIEAFERFVKHNEMKIVAKQHYFINPIYKYKFGYKPSTTWKIVQAVPGLRNLFTTGVYYLIKP